MRRNQRRRQEAATQEQAVANHNEQVANFNRTFAVCMEGRGYTVR
jgi:hypothetical protein